MSTQREERDGAMAAVEVASAYWRPFAMTALREAACQRREITSDDVWRVLHAHGIPDPREPRAMGPIMVSAVSEEWIAQTDRTRISDDPASPNHSRPQRVYTSRILGDPLPSWARWNPAPQRGPVTYDVTAAARGESPWGAVQTPGMAGRQFPLRRDEDGKVVLVTQTCPDCGAEYSVESDHRSTLRHREAVAKSQTVEGQTEIPIPAQPPVARFTEMPRGVSFGDILMCPSCKGTFRTSPKTKSRPAYRREYTSTMAHPDIPCARCGGFGVVPNQGPTA